MKKPSIFKMIGVWFKRFVAFIGWKLFIWASDTTQEEYWHQIYLQEKQFIDYGVCEQN